MTISPRHWARYVTPAVGDRPAATHDMYHYDDDLVEFADEHGRVWTRVALTKREYASAALARSELDTRERETT